MPPLEVVVRRSLLVTAFTVLFAALAASVAAAKPTGEVDQPCTLVTVQQIEKGFGGPVAEPIFNETFVVCDYHVGDITQPPGGIATVAQLFPGFAQTQATPKAAFVDQRAVDQLSEYELVAVNGVGKNAYLNLTTGTIVFQTKAMLLAIQWQPGSTPTEPDKPDQKQLIKLAKLAAKNAPTK